MPDLNERLFTYLQASAATPRERDAFVAGLNAAERGEAFVTAAYLVSVLTSLEEENWLQAHGEAEELPADRASVPLAFLRPLLADAKRWKAISRAATALGTALVTREPEADLGGHRATLRAAASRMSALLAFENDMGPRLGALLHRAFDGMDALFGLAYQGALDPTIEGERVFTGSGAGVQSSYVTILAALRKLKPRAGARLVDLGSGYGRVGLLLGLVRPDMEHLGFEYVAHRVDTANRIAERAGIAERVRFFAQDLGDPAFAVPAADIYYLYDPFSPKTYGLVMDQLRAMGRRRPIAVVTKGNAGSWLEEAIVGEGWSAERYDFGNMCLFRSPAPR